MEQKYEPMEQEYEPLAPAVTGDPVESLKLKMEGWRELVVMADSVLGWDKEWYPAVTAGSVTVVYLLLWYLEPSFLTLLSLLGLSLTLADFLVPRALEKLLPPSGWSSNKEKQLDSACRSLLWMTNLLSSLWSSCSGLRTTSPLTHFAAVTTSLLAMAYLGSMFSGLLLSYLVLMVLLMLPGLHRNGLLEQYFSSLVAKVRELTQRKKLE